ncbi:MAG: hypothetical protein KUG77_13295 [Nannocystaceae bacterium]|nr:hypothetical protein [Nannocystaceae bacterium]
MKHAVWCGLVAFVGLGCPASDTDESIPSGSGTGTGEVSSTSADPSASTAGGSTETGLTPADSSSGDRSGPIPASGISVDWVEANQAVGVRIGEDGGGVGGEGRTSPLIANRITLVRAFWEIDDDWTPREVEAQFTVNYPDGTSDTKIDRKMVEGPSFIGNLNEGFYWGLMAEETLPGMTYHIELFETDPAFADDAVSEPPRLPEDGSEAFVGIEESYQLLKVVIVPFNYDFGECTREPDLSEETMQLFYDYMYMMMPVDTLDIEVMPNVDWDGELTSFVPLNQYMAGRRVDDAADPEVFYYGLVDVCSGGLGGAGGLANGIPSDPTSPDVGYQRVSSGLSLPNNPEFSADTFVHEVGHSLGRRHVACNGEEGGPDPTYPIEGGDLGEWGFGVIDFQLRHPTVYKDYMTYCNPAWVSTWGLNKVFPTIRALSMWDEGFPGADAVRPSSAAGSVLIGNLLPDGSELWYTSVGRIGSDKRSSTTTIEFQTPAGPTVHKAHITELPDMGGSMIVAELPMGFDRISAITRLEGTKRLSVDRSAVRAHVKTR